MRWYQGLYWKMFLVIWLVSLVGMSSVYLLLNSRLDNAHKLEVLEARAQGQARLMLERYERQDPDWKRAAGDRHHRLRLWLYSADGTIQLTHWRLPPPEPTLDFELITASGRTYRVRVPLPRDERHVGHLLGRLFSLQMVLILLVSALSGGVLSALVVRPIRRLSDHVRDLHEHRDLSLRADRRLSERHDEIGELTREFDQMADYVEQTLSARQQLLQDVSHELRAPLARLQAAAGLIEQRLTPDDPMLIRINRECERLDALIGEILHSSRQQQSRAGANFSLTELCHELVEEVRLRQPERPFRLELPNDEVSYNGERALLHRALQNGIENLLRHTPASVPASLSLQTSFDGGVQLQLEDAGPGVDPSLLPKLFEPFVRGEGNSGSGFGLGMSIAKRAVEQMGGEIKACNRPEGGLVLRIWLPLAGRPDVPGHRS